MIKKPVAVLSTVTGNIITSVKGDLKGVPPNIIASDLAILAGSVVLAIGLLRCGWIVDLLPLTSLTAFMTGSAFSIAMGQVPNVLGLKGFSTRDATYKVVINTLKHLPETKIDAAMGLTALAMLYLIRFTCNQAAKKWPNHQRLIFFLSTLRTAFVLLLYTMISWLVNMNRRTDPRFVILGTIPRGMQIWSPASSDRAVAHTASF